MDKDLLISILQSVAGGRTTAAGAAERLEHMAYEDITYAHIDHHRSLRKGFPEVILAKAKPPIKLRG